MIEMKPMNGSIFFDTNILIYAYSSDEPEKRILVRSMSALLLNKCPGSAVIEIIKNHHDHMRDEHQDVMDLALDQFA